jgi:hypothetical protein
LGKQNYCEVSSRKATIFFAWIKSVLAITKPINGQSASNAYGSKIGFSADNSEQVDAWHAAGIAKRGINYEADPSARHGLK